MAVTTPDWLVPRAGTLQLGSDRRTYFVLLDGQAQYSLAPTPVRGKFGCVIRQTNNGRRLKCTGTYPGGDQAVLGGLEALRQALGW